MNVDEALALLRRGWSIIPCRARSKIPLIEWGPYQGVLPDERTVRYWWERWPDANAAIICGEVSGLVVVDIDPDKGGRIQDIDETTGLVVKTGGGGWHLFYKHPGRPIGNRAGVRPGIDIRGDGGYVIAPGSLHESGQLYSILTDDELAACPSWVDAATVKDERPPGDDKWLTRLLEHGCAEGERNTSTARLAGYYAKKGIPVDIAHTLIGDWSKNHLRPPLGGTEIRTTVYSVYRTEEAKARSRRSNIVVGATQRPEGKQSYIVGLERFAKHYGAVEPSWLCEGWMPSRTIAMTAAPPESLKSWLLLDMVVSVATGKPFLGVGKVADPGPVIVFQQEDDHPQVVERVTAIMLAKFGEQGDVCRGQGKRLRIPHLPDLPIYFHPHRELRFEDDKSIAALEKVVAELRPRLVVIDSLYSTINKDDFGRDAVDKMFPLKTMRDRYGTSFLFAHHTVKASTSWDRQDMWGSQFLNAFIEAGLQVRRIDGKTSCIIKPHFKNWAAGRPQWVDFDISTDVKALRYATTVRDATDDEMTAAVTKKEPPRAEKSDPYQRFYDWLCEHGPADVKTASEAMAESTRQTSRAFGKLQAKGKAFPVLGSKPVRWQAISLT